MYSTIANTRSIGKNLYTYKTIVLFCTLLLVGTTSFQYSVCASLPQHSFQLIHHFVRKYNYCISNTFFYSLPIICVLKYIIILIKLQQISKKYLYKLCHTYLGRENILIPVFFWWLIAKAQSVNKQIFSKFLTGTILLNLHLSLIIHYMVYRIKIYFLFMCCGF